MNHDPRTCRYCLRREVQADGWCRKCGCYAGRISTETSQHDWRNYLSDDDVFDRKAERMFGFLERKIDDPRYLPPNPEPRKEANRRSIVGRIIGALCGSSP